MLRLVCVCASVCVCVCVHLYDKHYWFNSGITPFFEENTFGQVTFAVFAGLWFMLS